MKRTRTGKAPISHSEEPLQKRSFSNHFRILLLILILPLLFSNNISNSNLKFKNNIENPFHDIFYSYYRDDVNIAKKNLTALFKNRKYRDQAIINYGLIQQYEKNLSDAEKSFIETYNQGERLAIIYLFNLYMNNFTDKYLELLNLINSKESSLWIEYERGIYYLKRNNSGNAIKHLNKAAEMGFCSTILLERENTFNQIKDTKEFRLLLKKVKRNKNKKCSLIKMLKKEELLYYKNKPYGISKKLQIASYFEKTKRYKMAEKILLSQINPRISFRDKSIALFSISRIKAKRGDKKTAKIYINRFIKHLSSKEKDRTGYKKLMQLFFKDIIKNDKYLKNLIQPPPKVGI